MSIIVERQFQAQIYNGQLTGFFSDFNRIASLKDPSIPKQLISADCSSGAGMIATSGTYTIPLPESYTNASYLAVFVGSPDVIRVKTTSPDHAASTVLLKGGSSNQDGFHACVEKITTLVIENTEADYVSFWYVLVMLPSITVETNFRGLQSTGVRTSVS